MLCLVLLETNVSYDIIIIIIINKRIQLNGIIILEQFVFQNSQYTFSEEKKTNKFFIDNTEYEILGKFDTVDAFVKHFNTLNPNIKMVYYPHLLVVVGESSDSVSIQTYLYEHHNKVYKGT